MTARELICCQCGTISAEPICAGCWHGVPPWNRAACCKPAPRVGALVRATGANGRAKGERHRIVRVMENTIWTRGETPGGPYFGFEDFVDRAIYCETFSEVEK